ncbi:type I-E CRISPR-associated protein Cse2/CasB, partial [Shigella boydii]
AGRWALGAGRWALGAGRWNITRLATPITNKINKGLSHDNIYSASFVNRLPCCQS